MKNFGKKRNKEQWKSGSTTRFLIAVLFGVQLLYALNVSGQQAVTVSGTVTDIQGQPLPGATVVEEGTTNGAVTNADGVYMITVPGNATLVFSFVGMKTQQVAVNSRTKIDIKFEEESIGLEEVVAIGYGKQSRKTLTTSVAKYNPEELNVIPINSVADGLKGKIAGARVYSNSGQPGESPTIIIRGGSSINKSNEALVLVDGFPRDLNKINPNDIESIEVLKDAAATAIYGSRASNGVVLVTTKQTKLASEPQFEFLVDYSYQEVERNYDLLNAEQYINLVRPAVARGIKKSWLNTAGYGISTNNDENSTISLRYLNDGEQVPTGWRSMPDPLDPSKTLIFVDTDWQDIIFNPSLRQNYYLGVSGGTKAVKYTGGFGYTDDDGIALETGYKRFTARANADVHLSDKISITNSIDFFESNTKDYYSQVNVITRALYLPPTQKVYNDDGTPTKGYNSGSPNPVWYSYYNDRSTVTRSLNLLSRLDWSIINNLSAVVSGTYYIYNNQFDSFEKANEFSGLRTATTSFNEVQRKQFEGYLNYTKSIEEHEISLVAGTSYLQIHNKSVSATAQGGSTDIVSTLNAAPDKIEATSSLSEEILIGYFSRVSYDYKKKYLFSASVRMDGSSKFGTNNKWATFPSLSVGWIISDEDFMKDQHLISNLKLRSSIGQTGNNGIDLYKAQGTYSVSYKYDGNSGIRNTAMPNNSLTWETTTQTDGGIDFGLLKNRITLIVDVFNKRTDNLLFSKPLPNTSGFSSIETNIGSVKFYGYDIELATSNIKKGNFSWTSSFSIGHIKNKVIKLPDNGRYKNRIGGIVVDANDSKYDFGGIAEGEPLYRFYGYVVDYILDNDEQATNARYDELSRGYNQEDGTSVKGRKFAGDYEWKDRNGDKKITDIDQFELGRTVPHTTGGIGNTFKYRNFSLRVFMDYAIGHSIMDVSFKYHIMNSFESNATPVVEALSAWKESGDAQKTKWARFIAHDSNEAYNYRRDSDVLTFKGDYLCIREVSLSYDIPERTISKWGMEKINLFISGNNLHYFTEIQATPPESTANYSSESGFPPVRKITAGIKVTF